MRCVFVYVVIVVALMPRFLGFPSFFLNDCIYFFSVFSSFYFVLFYFFATVVKKSIIITIKKPGDRLKTKKKNIKFISQGLACFNNALFGRQFALICLYQKGRVSIFTTVKPHV